MARITKKFSNDYILKGWWHFCKRLHQRTGLEIQCSAQLKALCRHLTRHCVREKVPNGTAYLTHYEGSSFYIIVLQGREGGPRLVTVIPKERFQEYIESMETKYGPVHS